MSSNVFVPGKKDRCLKLLGDITSVYGILPTSYYLPEVTVDESGPYLPDDCASIWRGQLYGRKVLVKVFRNDSDGELLKDIKRVRGRGPIRNERTEPDLNQVLFRNLVAWKHVTHENVLPFLGVSLEIHAQSARMRLGFSLISAFEQNGNIVEYTSKKGEVNRLELVSNLP